MQKVFKILRGLGAGRANAHVLASLHSEILTCICFEKSKDLTTIRGNAVFNTLSRGELVQKAKGSARMFINFNVSSFVDLLQGFR